MSACVSIGRFLWWSPRLVTQPWRPRVFRGCDEWHNPSWAIVLPFLGCFIVFVGREFGRPVGGEHLWAFVDGGWEGEFVDDCAICGEIKADATT